MYVRVSGDRVETCPISGTIARGSNPIEDADAIRTLLSSVKEESELTMCTDVDRNDKSRVCVPGTVKVIGRRQIEMYSRLIHTVDHIEGRLRPEFDALDAFLTHMWAVTVTGAPKTWAMQFIEDHEDTTRRWYGGAVGFMGFDGSMNTGLTLRTAQIRDGVATVGPGATLLYDSDPDAEERETELKASALLGALAAVGAAAEQAAAGPAAGAAGRGLKVLLVDHEDSFVNTLADYFRQQGAEVVTLRHGFPVGDDRRDRARPRGAVARARLAGRLRPAALVDALYASGLPVFGVCLGLQGMVEQAGGELGAADRARARQAGQVRRPATARSWTGCRRSSPRRVTTRSTPSSRGSRFHHHRAHPGRRGDGDRGRGEPALRRAVPPRVDPHRPGRRRSQDHRQRPAALRYRCESREITLGSRRVLLAGDCGRIGQIDPPAAMGGVGMRLARRAARRAPRHGAGGPARSAGRPSLPRGAPRRPDAGRVRDAAHRGRHARRRPAPPTSTPRSGAAVRRWCAPVLDLDPHVPPAVYLARRAELGAAEVNRRLLGAAGIVAFLVDAGSGGAELLSAAEMGLRAAPRPTRSSGWSRSSARSPRRRPRAVSKFSSLAQRPRGQGRPGRRAHDGRRLPARSGLRPGRPSRGW